MGWCFLFSFWHEISFLDVRSWLFGWMDSVKAQVTRWIWRGRWGRSVLICWGRSPGTWPVSKDPALIDYSLAWGRVVDCTVLWTPGPRLPEGRQCLWAGRSEKTTKKRTQRNWTLKGAKNQTRKRARRATAKKVGVTSSQEHVQGNTGVVQLDRDALGISWARTHEVQRGKQKYWLLHLWNQKVYMLLPETPCKPSARERIHVTGTLSFRAKQTAG